ncbi:PilZ domain-containing protein [Endothiovibrio diazotrophicus]
MVDVLAEHIYYEGELPVAWSTLEALPEWPVLARLNQADEELLEVISGQEQIRNDFVTDDEDSLTTRLGDIESKLNLVIDLVGQLLRQNLIIPAATQLRFNADGIVWRAGEGGPEVGALVMVELYPSMLIPRPIRLPGRVAAVTRGVVQVAFEGVGAPLADLIHKYVFRYHRRAVALARAARG